MAPRAAGTYVTAALLACVWIATGLLAAVHVLGFVSTPGISAVSSQCPPRWTGLHDLCAPVSVRVHLLQEVPPGAESTPPGMAELSGPVEVTLALLNPTLEQRVAHNTRSALAWLTAFGALSPLVWQLRPTRLRRLGRPRAELADAGDDDGHEDIDLGNVARGAGIVVFVGGVAAVLAQRWGVQLLASAAGFGYPPAEMLPVGALAVPMVIGACLVLVGRLHAVTQRQREDLRGLV